MLLSVIVAASAPDAGARDPLVVARPFHEVVPPGLVGPAALVVLIHGLGSSGDAIDAYFKLSALAEKHSFILALPDGVIGVRGQRSWNATEVCCAFGKGGDDVAYLVAVIRDLQARRSIDPKRIFIVGHSNGGFMAHRLACEHAGLIAGIVSLAGSTWNEEAKCQPSQPVSVLQVHGTVDPVIKYAGGPRHGGVHPGAEKTLGIWAKKNGCGGKALRSSGTELDLVSDVPDAETQRESYEGCPAAGAVELWRLRGVSHIPKFSGAWAPAVVEWLMAHPKH